MIKLCDETRGKALCLIYNDCIKTGVFPNIWKKSIIVPACKRGNIHIICNYRPAPFFLFVVKSLKQFYSNQQKNCYKKNYLLCQYQFFQEKK